MTIDEDERARVLERLRRLEGATHELHESKAEIERRLAEVERELKALRAARRTAGTGRE